MRILFKSIKKDYEKTGQNDSSKWGKNLFNALYAFTLFGGKTPPNLYLNNICIDVYIKIRIKMNVYYSGK